MSKRSSKLLIIPLSIGICISVIGLVLLIIGITTPVPAMGENGWFDAASKQDFFVTFGPFLIVAGIMVSVAGTLIIRSTSREYQAKQVANAKNFLKKSLKNWELKIQQKMIQKLGIKFVHIVERSWI